MADDHHIGEVTQEQYFGAVGILDGRVRKLEFQEDVFAEEIVKTTASGGTELRFVDRSLLHLGINTTIILDEFVYDPDTQEGSTLLHLLGGAISLISGVMTNKTGAAVQTEVANVGLRGTELIVYVFEDKATQVNVYGGAVRVTPCGDGDPIAATAGDRILVCPNCRAVTDSSGTEMTVPAIPTLPTMEERLSDRLQCPSGTGPLPRGVENQPIDRPGTDSAGGSIGGGLGD